MLRATLKSLLSRKLRLILSGLAVVLGVMFVSGSLVLTDTIGRTFDQMFATAYENVDVVVIGETETSMSGMDTTPVPGDLVRQLEELPETRQVIPEVYQEGARAIDNRTGRVVSTFNLRLGSNWFGETDLVELREGRGPTADDEVAINAELARAGGFSVGDTIGVLTREPRQDFTVVGIFGYAGDRDSLFGETNIAFTTPVAQQLMIGQEDVYTEISLFAAEGTTPEELRDQVTGMVTDEFRVRTAQEAIDEAGDETAEALAFFNYILLGFAGVALFVGIFLVLNTFSIIVAQRLRELALLRAVGASRRQMLGSIMLEAAVIGLVASTVGLLIGIGVGVGLAALAGGLFGGAALAGIGVPWTAVVSAYAVGMIVTLLAALLPALRASRVPPVAAMQEAATPDRPLTRLAVSGAVVTAAAVAALAVSLTGNAGDGTLLLVLLGVLLAFIGVALLTPLFARPVTSILGRVFSWSVAGKLGRRNTGRNPRRTAITAAALMIGVALVTGVSTIFSSLQTSVDRAIDTGLRAELIIAGEQTGPMPPTFDPAVLQQARDLPEVATVVGSWFDLVELDGEETFTSAVDDLPALQETAGLTATEGTFAPLAADQVVVDDRTAEQRNLSAGDTVSITLPHGAAQEYEVVMLYERTELMQGFVISAEHADTFRAPHPVQGYLTLTDGAVAEEVRLQVEQLLADSPEVGVQDRSGFVEQQTQIFDQLLVFVQILLVLAMVIAVLGVINTLVLSVIERTRELGLLRAVGLGRGATGRMVTVESVVISLFGALLGIGVGAALGASVVYALRDEGFTHLSLPWGLMATYLVVAALVGVVAALIPAIRAARLNVLGAIAYE